jgi:hypothetical protein
MVKSQTEDAEITNKMVADDVPAIVMREKGAGRSESLLQLKEREMLRNAKDTKREFGVPKAVELMWMREELEPEADSHIRRFEGKEMSILCKIRVNEKRG